MRILTGNELRDLRKLTWKLRAKLQRLSSLEDKHQV